MCVKARTEYNFEDLSRLNLLLPAKARWHLRLPQMAVEASGRGLFTQLLRFLQHLAFPPLETHLLSRHMEESHSYSVESTLRVSRKLFGEMLEMKK